MYQREKDRKDQDTVTFLESADRAFFQTVASAVKDEMLRNKITPSMLAERAVISPRTLGRVLSGKGGYSTFMLARVLHALDITYDMFQPRDDRYTVHARYYPDSGKEVVGFENPNAKDTDFIVGGVAFTENDIAEFLQFSGDFEPLGAENYAFVARMVREIVNLYRTAGVDIHFVINPPFEIE